MPLCECAQCAQAYWQRSPGWFTLCLFVINKYLREQGLATVQTLFFLELPPSSPLVLASLHQRISFPTLPSWSAWCPYGDFPNLSHQPLQIVNFLIPFFCRSLASLGSIHGSAFLPSKSSLALYFQFTPTAEQRNEQYPFVNWMTCRSSYSKHYD